jgi:putative transposase
MMLNSSSEIVKTILKRLPKNDYPVLNTRLFVLIWLHLIFDKSLGSLRDLFFLTYHQGIAVDLSTFSKASKNRDYQVFNQIYVSLNSELRKRKGKREYLLYAIDSTVITLTSKLFWMSGYHQTKLVMGVDAETGSIGERHLHFGFSNDENFAELMMTTVPENGIAVENRGFCSFENLLDMSQIGILFIVRIKNNYKWEFEEEEELVYIGSKKQAKCRVISFGDLETKTEYQFATNVDIEIMSDEEIAEGYRQRWAIEIRGQFLKMHLKLDRLWKYST